MIAKDIIGTKKIRIAFGEILLNPLSIKLKKITHKIAGNTCELYVTFFTAKPNNVIPSVRACVVAGNNKYPTAATATKRFDFKAFAVVTATIIGKK